MRTVLIFLFILGLIACAYAGQIGNQFKTESAINLEFTNLYSTMQEKFRILTTTPTIDQLKEREFVIVNTGAVSLFTKINGSTYSFTLERK